MILAIVIVGLALTTAAPTSFAHFHFGDNPPDCEETLGADHEATPHIHLRRDGHVHCITI